jgi:hypothetical protein
MESTMKCALIAAAALLAASFGAAEAGCMSWQIDCNGTALNGGVVDGYGTTWNRNLGGGWSGSNGQSWSKDLGGWKRSDGYSVERTLGGAYRDSNGDIWEQNLGGGWSNQRGEGCRQLLGGGYACD